MQIILASLTFFFINNSLAFQNTTATFTALSDYQKFVLTVFFSPKNTPKELFYQDYKNPIFLAL